MKIKGVIRTKKNYGEVIEFSAEEKVPLALQDGLAVHKEFDGKCLVFIRDTKLTHVASSPKGDPLKKKWQNNIYHATGSSVLHRRSLKVNNQGDFPMLSPRSVLFEIEFEDCLDPIGQPELKVTKLVLK